MKRAHRLSFYVAAILLGLASTGPGTSAIAAEPGYFSQIDDLPLMRGLNEVAGAGMAFDKPGGRIVEAFAEGAVSVSAVEAFYDKALPELGWIRATAEPEKGTWHRDNERLELNVVGDRDVLRVRVMVTPE